MNSIYSNITHSIDNYNQKRAEAEQECITEAEGLKKKLKDLLEFPSDNPTIRVDLEDKQLKDNGSFSFVLKIDFDSYPTFRKKIDINFDTQVTNAYRFHTGDGYKYDTERMANKITNSIKEQIDASINKLKKHRY
jgi:hypothetical protein